MAFQLKPNKKESENKTIRFPIPLIHKIEAAIQNQDVTFSSFVIQLANTRCTTCKDPITPMQSQRNRMGSKV